MYGNCKNVNILTRMDVLLGLGGGVVVMKIEAVGMA